jgi:type IV pilus assembly protein PilM
MSESIWKKEIRLRKPKQPKPEAPKPEPQAVAKAEEPSIWKKELRLRKQRDPLPPFPGRLLEQQRATPAEPPRGTVVIPVIPEPSDSVQQVQRWAARVSAPRPEFPRPAAAGERQEPVALLPQEHATAPADPSPEPVAPASVHVEPVSDTDLVSDTPHDEAPAVITPEPVAEKALLLKREDWTPPATPEPVAPAAVHVDPVPVDAKPAVVAPEPVAEKVPLLKREISLRRTPKPPRAVKTAEQTPKAERKPLLKRELSLPKRGPKQAAAGGHDKATRVVGLRIGSSQIAAAHVENNGSAQLVQLAREPLDRGIVVAGEVREPVALGKALKAFFGANKLPRKDIRLGIASSRIGVRVLEVPAVDDPKQFENVVRFRAQEVLPLPVADAVLDHVVLSDFTTDQGEAMRRILLVFAHRELVARYVEVCRNAGLRLVGIDLDAFALLRALVPAKTGEAPNHAVVAVAVGHERTVFAVSDGEICEFTRVLEWGSSSIDVAIARALNLTPSEAQPFKHALDLDAVEPPEGLSPMQFEAVRAAAKSEIGALVRELVSSLRFYQSQPDSLAVGQVLLTGGGAQLGGFAAELERGLGAPVRIADPFAHVVLGKKVTAPDDPGSLSIAVGLAVEA